MRLKMKKNVGNLDSILRVFTGAILLAAGIYFESWLMLLGIILVFSGSVSWCPVYKMLNINTYPGNVERES